MAILLDRASPGGVPGLSHLCSLWLLPLQRLHWYQAPPPGVEAAGPLKAWTLRTLMVCGSKQVTRPVRIQVGAEKDSSSHWEKWPSHQAAECASKEGGNLAISGNPS